MPSSRTSTSVGGGPAVLHSEEAGIRSIVNGRRARPYCESRYAGHWRAVRVRLVDRPAGGRWRICRWLLPSLWRCREPRVRTPGHADGRVGVRTNARQVDTEHKTDGQHSSAQKTNQRAEAHALPETDYPKGWPAGSEGWFVATATGWQPFRTGPPTRWTAR